MIEELFVVLIPEGEVKEFAQKIQHKISSYYNIYYEDSYPEIHLTVDKIKPQIQEKTAIKVVDEIVGECKPVKIKLEEVDCFLNYESNFLVLKVAPTKSLLDFAGKLHRNLDERSISAIKNYKDWEFHITLISNHFARNPLDEKNFENLCQLYSGIDFPHVCTTGQVELWRFTLDPDRKKVARFDLR